MAGITHVLGVIVDKMSMAQGFVHHELANDESLQESLAQELESLFYLISNRMRIAALLASDVVNGKKIQLTYNQQHQPAVVEEEQKPHQEQPQEEEPK